MINRRSEFMLLLAKNQSLQIFVIIIKQLIKIMAFVIPTAKPIHKIQNIPGPGNYNIQPHKIIAKSNQVAFNSSTSKDNHLKTNISIGPQSYETILIKDVYPQQKKESIVFKSKVPRFQAKTQQSQVGPGSYCVQPKKEDKYSKNKENRMYTNKSPLVRIIYRNPNSTQNYLTQYVRQQYINKSIGPGDYQLNSNKKDVAKEASTWSKSKTKRFSQKNEGGSVGPGCYQIQQKSNNLKKQSAPFASCVVRTYFDSLIYKTNVSQLATIRRQMFKYKDQNPGPGHYSPEILKKKAHSSQKFNGSTTVRTFSVQNINNIGPGTYNPKYPGKNSSPKAKVPKNKIKRVVSSIPKKSFDKQQEKQVQIQTPGPGHYQNNAKTLRQQLFNKFKLGHNGQFGRRENRWKKMPAVKSKLGPGCYNVQNKQKQQRGISFSHSKRQFLKQASKIPFGNYNIDLFDINKNVQKKRQFIQNLQKIEVYRPPFESRVQRFKSAPSQKQNKNALIYQTFLDKQILSTSKKRKNKEGTSVFQSKTNRFNKKQKQAPPPGYYHIENSNEKRSYSLKYGYKATQKD